MPLTPSLLPPLPCAHYRWACCFNFLFHRRCRWCWLWCVVAAAAVVVVVPGLVRTATALGKWVVRKWWNSDAFRHKYFSHPYEQEGMTRGLLKDPELGLLKDHITVLDWKNLNPSAGQTFREPPPLQRPGDNGDAYTAEGHVTPPCS